MSRKETSLGQRILHIIPGLIVCIIIAIVSKMAGKEIPELGAATISIFLGIIIGNTIGKSAVFHKGTKFSESTLLSISVALLGATIQMSTLLELGIGGILFIIFQMAITIYMVIWIGSRMKFGTDFKLLMASGNSVCGSSAIASTASVIHAHSRDKGITITMVNVTGTVLMIVLPIISTFLYKNDLEKTSALIGGILQSVGQVVASGAMISEEVKDLATIFKIVRIIFLVAVVFILSIIKNKNVEKGAHEAEEEIHSKTHHSRICVPWYIIAFFVLCIINTVGWVPIALSKEIKELDNFIEIVALAGIGMRVYFPDLVKQGAKTSLYCFFIAISQIVSAIILIKFFI